MDEKRQDLVGKVYEDTMGSRHVVLGTRKSEKYDWISVEHCCLDSGYEGALNLQLFEKMMPIDLPLMTSRQAYRYACLFEPELKQESAQRSPSLTDRKKLQQSKPKRKKDEEKPLPAYYWEKSYKRH